MELSQEQLDRIPEYVEKWMPINRNCDPCNEREAFLAAQQCYRDVGDVPPVLKAVFDSPISAAMGCAILRQAEVSGLINWKEWERKYADLDVSAIIEEDIGQETTPAENYIERNGKVVPDPNSRCLKNAIREIKNRFPGALTDEVIQNSVASIDKSDVGGFLRYQTYGSLEAGWAAWAAYNKEVLNADVKCDGMIEITKHCGWWSSHEYMICLQHRPKEIHFNDRNRLDNTSGMALLYRDGMGVWIIDGTTVDRQMVMAPETQTVTQIRKEPNAEVKRIRIERYGWDKFLAEINAEVLDERINYIENSNKEVLLKGDGYTVLICACTTTARVYAMEVGDDVKTCEDAQTWLRGRSTGRCVGSA